MLFTFTMLAIIYGTAKSEFKYNLENCALGIIYNIPTKFTTFVWNTDSDILDNMLRNGKSYSLINLNVSQYNGTGDTTDLYIFYVNSLIQFSQFLRTWPINPRANYFVINVSVENVRKLFELFWKYYILQVAILVKPASVYSFSSFNNDSCGEIFHVEKIYECNKDRHNMPEMFNHSLTLTSIRCPLRVLSTGIKPYTLNISDIKNPGIDVLLLRELARRTNLSYYFIDLDALQSGNNSKIEPYAYSKQMVSERKADVVVGMAGVSSDPLLEFESSNSYMQESITFFVPVALPTTRSLILKIFPASLWLFIAGAFFSNLAILWISENVSITYTAWELFTLSFPSFYRFPQNQRICFHYILWAISCFIIVSMYQSKLSSFLTKSPYERQITSIAELASSNLKYGGSDSAVAIIRATEDTKLMPLLRNWHLCTIDDECVKRAAQERDFAVIKAGRYVDHLISNSSLFPNGKPTLYQLRDGKITLNVAFGFAKGFPHKEKFNLIIGRIVDSGILSKFESDTIKRRKFKIMETECRPLTFKHIKEAFQILIYGFILSGSTLVCEMLWSKFNHSSRECVSSAH